MSGSRDKGAGRHFIDELKETLRMHFQGVATQAVPLSLDAVDISYAMPVTAETYGGVLMQQSVLDQAVSLVIQPEIQSVLCAFHTPVLGVDALVGPPGVVCVPPITAFDARMHRVPVLPAQAKVTLCPLEHILPPALAVIKGASLKFSKRPVPRPLVLQKFRKPVVMKLAGFKTTALRFAVHKNPLPIQRMPIPPHRFSAKQRRFFRELLAEKSQIPVQDVQLVGIYDRLYLGLYQSMSFAGDGTLICIPRKVVEKNMPERMQVPVYLVIGKSFKAKAMTLQAVLPMGDLDDGEAE